ncbi:MAG: hypothetical protein PHN55_14235, partial [Dysgonamonadaceae bacterium]|nr:hypothetical protein [Dysgonamonadaceae bacterium]
WCPSKVATSRVTLQRTSPAETKTIVTTNTYDDNGLLKKSVANGVTRDFTYASYGALLTSSISGTNVTGVRTSSYTYNFKGMLIKETSPSGLVNEYQRDSYGRIIKEILPNGNAVETLSFNGFGRVIEQKSPTGIITTNRIFKATDYGSSYLVQQTMPGIGTTKIWKDTNGRLKRTESPGLNGNILVTGRAYNYLGQVAVDTLPHYIGETPKTISYKYDYLGRVIEKVSNGVTVTYTYNFNTVTETSPMGTVITRNDATGNPLNVNTNGQAISTEYNVFGKPVSVTTPWGANITMGYDTYGNQNKLDDPSSKITRYVSNALGEMMEQTNAMNQKVIIQYDNFGRVLKSSEPDFEVVNYYGTSGGGIGQLATATLNGNVHSNYSYDNYGRVISESSIADGYFFTFYQTYDTHNRVTSVEYPVSRYKVKKNYDASNGMLKSLTTDTGAKLWEIVTSNGDGKITESIFGGNIKIFKTYNDKGLLTRLTTKKGTRIIQDFEYNFDDQTGNLNWRIDKRRTNRKEIFSYDDDDRLDSSYQQHLNKTYSYVYDAKGNITNMTGVGAYQYQLSRNMYAVTGVVRNMDNNIPSQYISYTSFGQPKEVVKGNYRALFEYAPDQSRRKMEIYEKGALIETWRYFGAYEQCKNHITKKTTQYNYISSPEGSIAVYITETGTNAQLYYILKDHQGSITALVDTSGTIVEEYSYDAWGRMRNVSDWTYDNLPTTRKINRGYTFHEHLPQFDLIHMNSRLYDPFICRFLSPDNYVQASHLPQNYNRYSYCLNNPLKYTDPSGELIFTLAALIAAPFTGGASLALLPYTIGADLGAWQGGTVANGTANPFKWDYSSGQTWGYMAGGAVVGAASGGAANAVATSGMAFANTAAIMTGSVINSVGMAAVTGGQTDVSISFGAASYNFTQGEWGYLGKKGNSALENIGYGLGALANVSDVLAGFNPGEVELQTENLGNDPVGHSQLNDGGNVLVDYGPTGDWAKFEPGRNDWIDYASGGRYKLVNDIPGTKFDPITIKGVNVNRLNRISSRLNSNPGNYQVLTRSCSSVASRALTLSGAPAMGLHPYLLHAQMYMRGLGVRPAMYSYFGY